MAGKTGQCPDHEGRTHSGGRKFQDHWRGGSGTEVIDHDFILQVRALKEHAVLRRNPPENRVFRRILKSMKNGGAIFKVSAGGPLEISGNFRLVSSEGRIIEIEGPVFLCRCGGSSNKPFCDDTHKHNGFSG